MMCQITFQSNILLTIVKQFLPFFLSIIKHEPHKSYIYLTIHIEYDNIIRN